MDNDLSQKELKAITGITHNISLLTRLFEEKKSSYCRHSGIWVG